MTVSEILYKNIVKLKRYKTIEFEGIYYAIYDIEIQTMPINRMIYHVKRIIYLKLNKKEKDFEILDNDFFRKKITHKYRVTKYIFKISKKKIFEKLREKYGDCFMEKTFGSEKICTDIVKYIDDNLFEKNVILIFNNKPYMSSTDRMLKYENSISRIYKLKTLKNKII